MYFDYQYLSYCMSFHYINLLPLSLFSSNTVLHSKGSQYLLHCPSDCGNLYCHCQLCNVLSRNVCFTPGNQLSVFTSSQAVAVPEFFCGGIEEAKCDSEGEKIQKFAGNGWFWPLFPSDWGKEGGQSLRRGGGGGANSPDALHPWCRHCVLVRLHIRP